MGLEQPSCRSNSDVSSIRNRTLESDEAALSELRDILASSLPPENVPLADQQQHQRVQPPIPPVRRRRLFASYSRISTTSTAGVTTVNPDNRPSTAPAPPLNTSRGGLHWFAHGAESFDPFDDTDETVKENVKDREERLRLVREKHDEERQRKLEELKQQALAVQRYREQKEEERKRRLEEMRTRDLERRQQVEERKRLLFEAEREKREAILKKNQEREARIESKKRNERSSIVFAFGSSTPRMLEPSETGGSYWASRRATSTSNVMMLSTIAPMGPLTRRSSERELNDCSGKKRAASAGGLSNHCIDDFSENKRKSLKDILQWDNLCQFPAISEYSLDVGQGVTDGDRSAERKAARRKTDLMPTIVSPRDLTPSRPGSASSSRRSPGMKSGEMTPVSRPQSSMSQSIIGAPQPRSRPVAIPRKPRPISIAVTGITALDQSIKSPASGERPPLPKLNVTKKAITPKVEMKKFPSEKPITKVDKNENAKSSGSEECIELENAIKDEDSQSSSIQESVNEAAECDMTASMLATKLKITTEEEAKAALAERRKLAREQAEREAELERLRLEAERLAEEERIKLEEEEQRRQEEEQLRLLEEARKAEEVRLQLAIEETKKREEEEKKRKEDELKLKLEKEESERKAKEEAEKLRQEMEIKLKKEEEDRQLRRKRVEAIMLRTRNQGKGSTNINNKEETDSTDLNSGDKTEKISPVIEYPSQNQISNDAFLNAEKCHISSLINGVEDTSKQNGHASNSNVLQNCSITVNNDQQNANGFVSEPINNVSNSLLDLSLDPIPSNTISTQIIDIGISKCVQDSTSDFAPYQETNRSEQQIVNDLLS
ncbi:ensconsin-like isoform X14 [Daktulosphaira vitifoliae]|uniref:ensconsin-like isoform X14 n=1 Tax=Daktulosphaira vitifoliae TaxID=58002 RepID=UPI0021AA315D|nr:ensconsin-like isoform X14 [Daktulosphaira vitifoliae]